jgi:putative endopeptidase
MSDPFFDDPEGGYGAEQVGGGGAPSDFGPGATGVDYPGSMPSSGGATSETDPLFGGATRGAGPNQARSPPIASRALMFVSALAFVLMICVVVMAVYIAGHGIKSAAAGGGAAGGSPAGGGTGSASDLVAIATEVKDAMDTAVKPCDNFYKYACGGWLASNQIPDDKSSFGRGFSMIADRVNVQVQAILEADSSKIGHYYQACLDNATANAHGVAPARALLDSITVNATATLPALMQLAGSLREQGVSSFLSLDVGADARFPDLNVLNVGQGGLSLPSRNYYLEEAKQGTRDAYKAHVSRMLALVGLANGTAANATAAEVLAFEIELAKLHLPPAELRDPVKTYNRYVMANLTTLAGKLPIKELLTGARFPTDDTLIVNVDTPTQITAIGELLAKTPLTRLRAYLRWHAVGAVAGLLSDALRDESFEFYGRELEGTKAQRPPQKRCVVATAGALSELVGRVWVDKHFAGSSKAKAKEILSSIIASLRAHIPTLDWMDLETKKRAYDKLGMVKQMVGYPSKWRDYASVTVTATDHYANAMSVRKYEYADMLDRLHKPVDHDRWDMRAEEVNAYYSPNDNEMVFPAGIIQPSFFDLRYPDALNWGGIGAVMGHELGHSVDDQGSQFDGTGVLRNWWTAAATKSFKNRTKCIVDQYSKYKVGDRHVNGTLTLGENLADNGGVKTAYRAFLNHSRVNGAESLPLIQGIDADQLFFIGYAQSWCELRRPGFAEMLLLRDPHSPSEFRVNGPLKNSAEFAEAWGCAPGSPMNPQAKCTVF